MSLIVETGAGASDSESYISVVDAATYHAARGNTSWASLASDTVREQLLRKATEYMVQAYRQSWKGVRLNLTQALDWPRSGVVVDGYLINSDFVPTEVKRACAELALKASTTTLAPDVTQAVKREKVDVIEVDYADYSSQIVGYRAIDLMLAPYLDGYSGANVRLVRA